MSGQDNLKSWYGTKKGYGGMDSRMNLVIFDWRESGKQVPFRLTVLEQNQFAEWKNLSTNPNHHLIGPRETKRIRKVVESDELNTEQLPRQKTGKF